MFKQIIRMFSFHSKPFFTFPSNADKQRKKLEKNKGREGLTKQQKRKREKVRLNTDKKPVSANDTNTDDAQESEEVN